MVVFAVLLLFSYRVWIVLEPYKLRALATLIPVLFALQVFINDTLEAILSSKFYRTWWFKFIIAPGTILHELCHLLAALASGCKVSSVSLFRINPASGTMG